MKCGSFVRRPLYFCRLTLLVLALIVPPLTGAMSGAWLVWDDMTTSWSSGDEECGMGVFPVFFFTGVGGLVGLAVGCGVSAAIAAAMTAWSTRNLDCDPEAAS
jgi:hypothetical protein